MSDRAIILWFRRDLRLSDHQALTAAQATGRPVIPVFINDQVMNDLGAAPKWRFGKAIKYFQAKLQSIGSDLILRTGDPVDVLTALMAQTGASDVYWSRAYDPASVARDTEVKAAVNGTSFKGQLLFEPWIPKTGAGGYFKVYTPYWRHVSSQLDVSDPLPAVRDLRAPEHWPESEALSDWDLGADMHRGARVVEKYARVGEEQAFARLDQFLDSGIDGYKEDRDFPMKPATSGLSENFTYGEMSVRTAYRAGQMAMDRGAQGGEHFLKEIAWREFAYHLLWHNPDLDSKCWKTDWEAFPWEPENPQSLAWTRGQTGQDFVDAGMRELYATGTMHNRLRMIVGSYLTKHLLTDWRVGLAWFADCLIDWDPAANAMGWQWIAGCGPDAAMYFRVFNPELQSERFDKNAGYRRRWLDTETSDHARDFMQATPLSWAMSQSPKTRQPLIELSAGRQRALDAYQAFKD